MRPLLVEIGVAIESKLYASALTAALILPDACGAVEYPSAGNGARYREWYDRFVGTTVLELIGSRPEPIFNGDVVWQIRNGLLHATELALVKYGYDTVYFTVPNPEKPHQVFHMCTSSQDGQKMLNLDLRTFCGDIIAGVERWLEHIAGDAEKEMKLRSLIQFRPNGHFHMIGVPLIA